SASSGRPSRENHGMFTASSPKRRMPARIGISASSASSSASDMAMGASLPESSKNRDMDSETVKGNGRLVASGGKVQRDLKKLRPARGEARRNRAISARAPGGEDRCQRGLQAPHRVSGGQVTRAA